MGRKYMYSNKYFTAVPCRCVATMLSDIDIDCVVFGYIVLEEIIVKALFESTISFCQTTD